MLACFGLGGLLNFSFQNVTEERTLILALLTAGCLVVFHHFGHYSRRRQLWQEFGDIAGWRRWRCCSIWPCSICSRSISRGCGC